MEGAHKLIDYSPSVGCIFIPTHWTQKMLWQSTTISSNRSSVRNHKMRFIHFTNVPSCLGMTFNINVYLRYIGIYVDFKYDTSLDDTYLPRIDSHLSEFSSYIQCSFLRHYQVIAVRIVHCLMLHILITSIVMNTQSTFHTRITRTHFSVNTFKPVFAFSALRILHWFPSALRRITVEPLVISKVCNIIFTLE